MSKKKIAMVTGHRTLPDPEKSLNTLKQLFLDTAPSLVISGGAVGADTIAINAAEGLKIPVKIMYPHIFYREVDNAPEDAIIEYIVDRDPQVPLKPWERVQDYQARNIAMLEAANMPIILSPLHPLDLLKEKKGGTVHAVKEMKKRFDFTYWVNGSICEEVQLNQFTQLTLG